jgi:hypothetical protein
VPRLSGSETTNTVANLVPLVTADAPTTRNTSSSSSLSTALVMLRVPTWIGVFYALLRTNADPDLWGHLRFGLDALASGRLTTIDPYSYTSDIPWLNHEWLSEVVIAAAYRMSGVAGLIAIKIAFTIATFALLLPVLRSTADVWRWPTAFLAVIGIMPVAFTVRPQLWTMFFLVLVCRILNAAPSRRWLLPLVFVVWANVHGGWIVGMGILLIWSLVELVGDATGRPTLWVSLGVPAACIAATLLNPYGLGLWGFMAQTVRLSRPNIIEWQPIWRESIGTMVLWLIAVGWVTFALRRSSVWRPQALAVVAAMAFASMRVNRLLPLFIPIAVVLLIPYVREPSVKRVWPKGRLAVDVAIIAAGVLLLAWPASAGCIQLNGSWIPDMQAARALAAARPVGRMATWFDWGEYAIWHFGPAAKVSIDGRRETVYSEEMLERQVAIAFGQQQGLDELSRSTPEYVWLPMKNSQRTRTWLAAHDYRIDIETPQSFVAVRRDLPRIEAVARTSAACFPGI